MSAFWCNQYSFYLQAGNHILTPERWALLFTKLALFVRQLQRSNIYHLDLKMNNILISFMDDEPRPVIIDYGLGQFGLNKKATSPMWPDMTFEGRLKAPHLDPELSRNSNPLPSTDVYSVMAACRIVGETLDIIDLAHIGMMYCILEGHERPDNLTAYQNLFYIYDERVNPTILPGITGPDTQDLDTKWQGAVNLKQSSVFRVL